MPGRATVISPTTQAAAPVQVVMPAKSSDQLPADVAAPVERVDAYLSEYLDGVALPANLVAAIRYSLLGPGKRARPLLTWHSFAAVAGDRRDPAESLPAAGAAELIHAFSLVHDDLPGLDNDDLRRGRPTLHKHTSEAMAILAGDAMLTLAFQLITERVTDQTLAARLALELALGTNGMIAGQVYDTLHGFGADVSPADRLHLIHRNKTGMLIRAAARMGAMTAGASPDHLAAISRYADHIGLMFQIVDDLLDVTQTTEHLGKKAGKDQDAGKLTYPGVFGIDASRAEVGRLHREALAVLAPFEAAADPLRHLADYLATRTR
jgi:geranylgeranyl pyrophosphate synthase